MTPWPGVVLPWGPPPPVGPFDQAVQINGEARTGNSPVVIGSLNESKKRVSFTTLGRKKGKAIFSAELQAENSNGQVVEVTAGAKAKLPKGSQLIVDYAKWSSSKPKGRTAHVKSKKGSKPVKVTTFKQ